MNDLRHSQDPMPKELFYRPNVDQMTFGVDNGPCVGKTLASCARYGGTVRIGRYVLVETLDVTSENTITSKPAYE